MIELQDLLPNSKKLSMLIIDPDNVLREKLVQDLRKVYGLVDDASTAYDGLSFCKINRYDVVIIDEKLHNMTTQQLIENIHSTKRDQKILFFSHDSSAQTLASLVNMELTSIVEKPLNMELFLTELSRVNTLAYNQNQIHEQLKYAKKIKDEQKKLLELETQKREKLLKELAYERKRIGKLLSENSQLSKKGSGVSDEVHKLKFINDVTLIENKNALQLALKEKGEKALIYLNIDHFDLVNTLYGMGTGNRVLKASAERIHQYLPKQASLYNITADEFVILISTPSVDQEKIVAKQIATMFQELPLEVDKHFFDLSLSIGLIRGDGLQLFVQAKIASKESKYYGGGIISTFDNHSPYMNKQREDLFWIKTIKSALHDNRIIPYYQPIISNVDNSIEHFEVLCRLKDESGKIIDAKEFIKAAEMVGLITKLTRLIIDNSFKHFSTNSYKFSINICGYDLYENYLVELLKYKCDVYNIAPSRVYLEIMGENNLESSEALLKQIDELKALGFNIGVDDVSIDYSIFNRMLQLDADFVKIDKSFINDLEKNSAHQNIVSTIVEFARKSGMKTVAEHVESKEELRLVSTLGVDYSQGFYVGKPNDNVEVIRE